MSAWFHIVPPAALFQRKRCHFFATSIPRAGHQQSNMAENGR
jgi:hypothetical protein